MHKLLGNMTISCGNVVWVAIVVVFLGLHTILFSHRLDVALKRIDKLEVLLLNTIATEELRAKGTALSWLARLKGGLDIELSQTEGKEVVLRATREFKGKKRKTISVPPLWKKIQRLERRVEKCRNRTGNRRGLKRFPRRTAAGRGWFDKPGQGVGYDNTKTQALFTVWGADRCIAQSKVIHTGQMVTTDGSDFLCLPDKTRTEHAPWRLTKTPLRNLSSSVNIRGVTYGDIEDVVSMVDGNPAKGANSKNNKTVPCAVCSRDGRTSSAMVLSLVNEAKDVRNFQREYFGVLMSAKESKKLVCVTVDAMVYSTGRGVLGWKKPLLTETVQLHPAELKCNSMYCDSNTAYDDAHRVSCIVVTI